MDVILFYKSLTKAGGAERLLLNQYYWLKKNKYSVKIVCFDFKNNLFLTEGEIIQPDDIIVFRGPWLLSILKLLIYLLNNKAEIIVSSGVKEIFITSLIARKKYNLLLHHPLFMTVNETDKFSLFLKNKFKIMCESNYGARIFHDQMKSFTFFDYIRINLKACISIPSIKFAKIIFVLSEYSQYEKSYLFNKESIVCRGAIKKDILSKMSFEKKQKDVLLCVSRLEDDKRIDILIKAFSKLLDIYPNKKLIICGTGSSEDTLKDLTKRLGIEKNVNFKGFVSDNEMESLNKLAYAFISLDWADYKITLFEALCHSQRIIVSTETSCINELEDLNHMIRVEPNAESAFEGLVKIFSSESKADYVFLKRFLDKYTWESYNTNLFKHVFQSNH
jgi:glycosyltransferase involved in cell wall biosynthesis